METLLHFVGDDMSSPEGQAPLTCGGSWAGVVMLRSSSLQNLGSCRQILLLRSAGVLIVVGRRRRVGCKMGSVSQMCVVVVLSGEGDEVLRTISV